MGEKTMVEVKKNGVISEKTVDEADCIFLNNVTKRLQDKDNPRDLYKYSGTIADAQENIIEVAEAMDEKRYARIKCQRIITNSILLNNKMATSLKAIRGTVYIKSILKRI